MRKNIIMYNLEKEFKNLSNSICDLMTEYNRALGLHEKKIKELTVTAIRQGNAIRDIEKSVSGFNRFMCKLYSHDINPPKSVSENDKEIGEFINALHELLSEIDPDNEKEFIVFKDGQSHVITNKKSGEDEKRRS